MAVLGLGYLGYTQFLAGGGPGGAEGVARDYVKALDDGDREKLQELTAQGASTPGQLMVSSYEAADVSIESSEVLSEETQGEMEFATVQVVASASGSEETSTLRLTLRKGENGWRVVQFSQG